MRARRAVARKKRHSGRQRKAKLRVARLHARVAAQRRDFSHKLSRSLVDRFTHLAFENLNISALARGMLAQSVHDAARNQIVQHVQLQGSIGRWRRRAARPARNLQTCPACGTVAPKTLAHREHRCGCGCVLDRNVAAARVVLHRADFGPGTGLRAPSERVAA